MNELVEVGEFTHEELMEWINDCRIRILEGLGLEVPASIREGASHENG